MAQTTPSEAIKISQLPKGARAATDEAPVNKDGVTVSVELGENSGGGGGGGSTEPNPIFVAGKVTYPESEPAPLFTRDLVNLQVKEQRHDDTGSEGFMEQFKVPSDIASSGNVTFVVYCSPVTAAASRNVRYNFQHSVSNNGESMDVPYTSEFSGDQPVSDIQNATTIISWQESIANLGWSANDKCNFILRRDNNAVPNNLGGEIGTFIFEIQIPRVESGS